MSDASAFPKSHEYSMQLVWTGNTGEGTKTYRSYSRNHTLQTPGKPLLEASSDPAFRGDKTRYNPEDLLLGALSSCHMLSYLHLCAVNHINVIEYRDDAVGEMEENADGSGRFVHVVLRPSVGIVEGDRALALDLHHEAHRLCFIANSVNFPVECEAIVTQPEVSSAG